MIFNSLLLPTIAILARDDRTAAVVAFFLATNKTFEGVCLALAGSVFKRSCEFFLYLKSFCKKDY